MTESYLINTSFQECYLLALKHFKLCVMSKEQLHFVVLRFWVSPLVASFPSVFVSSYELIKICFYLIT
jgi:hypothetical protein